MFNENPGGVRIDHIIGLVDPWVYKNGSKPKPEEGAGRLFSSPEHPELAKYAIARMENINTEYLNFDAIDKFKDFGGIRLEDDILITPEGSRFTGDKRIPITIEEVERNTNEQ
jgi:hypothetical protein